MTEPATGRTGMLLQPLDGGRPFRFDPGTLCLELLMTGGPGIYARHEVLHDPAALVEWVRRSRLAPGLERVLSLRQEDVRDARTVRDALLRLALDRARGGELAAADLAVINAAAAEPPLVPRIASDGTRAWAPGATGPGLLSTVARDAVDLFTGPFATRVRECAAHDCYLLFVDTSRPGHRRWCTMERCGTRNKVRAHRARTDTT
ncbi:CGNR zinc finger domain-containing protein [Streptomyces sp. NPDC056835]|uniref:CGNR zinc finger domain-containing protein n=1 Tax=Streptomyces sp. NPDC056835 TaxID=3345956 RepID=UPI00368F4170